MSREIRRIDRTLVAWLGRCEDPANALRTLEGDLARSSPRLGCMVSGNLVRRLDPSREDLEHVVLRDMGTVTGMILDEECRPAFHWDAGTLSIWNGQDILPMTVLAQVEGRRLGDVIEHHYVCRDAIVVEVVREGAWLRLICQEFSMPIEEARRMFARGRREEDGTGV